MNSHNSFWRKVDKDGPAPRDPFKRCEGPCWIWLGSRRRGGYGTIKAWGQRIQARRVAVFLQTGVRVCAKDYLKAMCNNKDCVNPSHMNYYGSKDHTNVPPPFGRRDTKELREEVWIRCVVTGDSQAAVAKELGIPRSTLQRMIQKEEKSVAKT